MPLSGHQLLRLSLADLLDEWPTSVAVTLAIAAVLAPLLVLNGLRTGVIGEIFERLREDPAMRRITLDATGARRFDDRWFRTIRERPDVAFILPSTRFAAAQVEIAPVDDASVQPLRVSLASTGPGDPVFGADSPPLGSSTEVKLSAAVAARAGLKLGDGLYIDVERRRANGRIEPAGIQATVTEIVPPDRHGGTVVFVRPDLLLAVEAFRDGFAAPELGFAAGPERANREAYPNFRLYTMRIEDVAGGLSAGRAGSERQHTGGLPRAFLRDEQDLSVSTQAPRIASAVELNRNIGAVLRAIVMLGVIGLAGSLAAIQWAVAARKRRAVAMLNLIGYGRGWLIGFPTLQAALLAASGSAAAVLLALSAATWINRYFAASFGTDGAACVIEVSAMSIGAAAVLLFSLVPAAIIGIGFTRLDPSDEIRDM